MEKQIQDDQNLRGKENKAPFLCSNAEIFYRGSLEYFTNKFTIMFPILSPRINHKVHVRKETRYTEEEKS